MLPAPRGKLLTIAFRAARVLPRGGFPSTSGPPGIAAAATQRANPDQPLQQFGDAGAMRHTGVARAALRTCQFHFPGPGSIIDRIGAELNVLVYVRGESLAETIADRSTAFDGQAFDADDR